MLSVSSKPGVCSTCYQRLKRANCNHLCDGFRLWCGLWKCPSPGGGHRHQQAVEPHVSCWQCQKVHVPYITQSCGVFFVTPPPPKKEEEMANLPIFFLFVSLQFITASPQTSFPLESAQLQLLPIAPCYACLS